MIPYTEIYIQILSFSETTALETIQVFFNHKYLIVSNQVSPLVNTDDLYKQPFRITFPMMHSCCQNNASPFQVKEELGQPSGGGNYFPFRTIILFFLSFIYRFPMRVSWFARTSFSLMGPG